MQGEENLKIVFHIFHTLNATTPSLCTIKNIKLPGFNEPKKVNGLQLYFVSLSLSKIVQHYTTEGVPFYVNCPSNIIKRCLGMAGIAKNIARFPVEPISEMRYECNNCQIEVFTRILY